MKTFVLTLLMLIATILAQTNGDNDVPNSFLIVNEIYSNGNFAWDAGENPGNLATRDYPQLGADGDYSVLFRMADSASGPWRVWECGTTEDSCRAGPPGVAGGFDTVNATSVDFTIDFGDRPIAVDNFIYFAFVDANFQAGGIVPSDQITFVRPAPAGGFDEDSSASAIAFSFVSLFAALFALF